MSWNLFSTVRPKAVVRRPPRLRLEALEDRLTPSGAAHLAIEYNIVTQVNTGAGANSAAIQGFDNKITQVGTGLAANIYGSGNSVSEYGTNEKITVHGNNTIVIDWYGHLFVFGSAQVTT